MIQTLLAMIIPLLLAMRLIQTLIMIQTLLAMIMPLLLAIRLIQTLLEMIMIHILMAMALFIIAG